MLLRNILAKVSHKHYQWVTVALKAIFAMDTRKAALAKAERVAVEMGITRTENCNLLSS